MERIRKETEATDFMSGFQLFYSLGGGCGSGLGSLILEYMYDRYENSII